MININIRWRHKLSGRETVADNNNNNNKKSKKKISPLGKLLGAFVYGLLIHTRRTTGPR